jgi:hypothetical protein
MRSMDVNSLEVCFYLAAKRDKIEAHRKMIYIYASHVKITLRCASILSHFVLKYRHTARRCFFEHCMRDSLGAQELRS